MRATPLAPPVPTPTEPKETALSDEQPLDFRSEEGVIVGLIDGMIAQARVVARYLAEHRQALPHEVVEALADARADTDVAAVVSRG